MVGALALLTWLPVYGQGTFQNLDFESATIPDLSFGQVVFESVAQALPGWNAFVGSTPPDWVVHNGIGGAMQAYVGIHGPVSRSEYILQGKYTLLLASGLGPTSSSITQTGTVPLDAQSFRFWADSDQADIFLDGQRVPLVVLGQFPGPYPKYAIGGSIEGWAGRTAELRIEVSRSGVFIDNIQFSSSPIPEPSASALLTVGALLLSWQRFRKQP